MQDFFRRLPLMAKLLLIVVVPLLFIGFLTIRLYKEKLYHITLIESYITQIDQSIQLSRLSSELQKERRHSFIYALKREHLQEMIGQRVATDSMLKKLNSNHDASLKDFATYTQLSQLDSIRMLIDRGTFNKDAVMHYYSNAIFRLNTLNKAPVLITRSLSSTNEDLTSQKLLTELITYQSIINANVFNVLFTRQYMVETLMGTYPSWDVYKSYEKEFEVKANAAALQKFQHFKTRGALHTVDAYLDRLFTSFKFDSSFTYESWALAADRSLHELRTYQEQLMGKVQKDIHQYYRQQVASRNRTIIYLLGITMFLIGLLAYVLHIINATLNQLKRAATRISEGETDIPIQPESEDAIGSLASSIAAIEEKQKALALAAWEIGNGNFGAEVKPRSEKDVLGNAIEKMKEQLLEYTSDLKNAKEEFETLADFMPQIVWTSDRFGKINYYNKKWQEITGIKDILGEQTWVKLVHPDDAGPSLAAWYQCVETGIPFEIEYRLKDVRKGEYRWFLGRAVPLTNANHEIVKWFGTATDIHDQKLQEARLEQMVNQRTLELNRSNEDLQQFAHVASHDLKEPLRKIRTFSNRLAMEYGASIPDGGKAYLEKLQATSERMSSMIDSILKYSMVNATEQTMETIDLNMIMDGIINDLELLVMQKAAKIGWEQLPQIQGTPTLIYQLFYNLVNNALKFSKSDVTPRINISAGLSPVAEVSAYLDRQLAATYHHITVTDNGIGFENAYAHKMFQAFTRLNGAGKYEGTGLGLALCKKIVLRHQGAIYATSEPGEGASFHILFPAKVPDQK